jgi:hypothetical protein
MRRQLVTKLLARRSLHSTIPIARLWQSAVSLDEGKLLAKSKAKSSDRSRPLEMRFRVGLVLN